MYSNSATCGKGTGAKMSRNISASRMTGQHAAHQLDMRGKICHRRCSRSFHRSGLDWPKGRQTNDAKLQDQRLRHPFLRAAITDCGTAQHHGDNSGAEMKMMRSLTCRVKFESATARSGHGRKGNPKMETNQESAIHPRFVCCFHCFQPDPEVSFAGFLVGT